MSSWTAKYVCVGSPTLNSQMLPDRRGVPHLHEGPLAEEQATAWAIAFGSYGWAPLGPNNVQKELEAAGFKLPEKAYAENWIPDEAHVQAIRDKVASLLAAGREE
jgi:flavorubredoxin